MMRQCSIYFTDALWSIFLQLEHHLPIISWLKSIPGVHFVDKCPPWLVYMICLSCFSFFSEIASWIFKLRCFNCSYFLVPLPFIKLSFKLAQSHIWKLLVTGCIPQNNPFGQHDLNCFIEVNVLPHLVFGSILSDYIATYDVHYFAYFISTFMYFLHFLCIASD